LHVIIDVAIPQAMITQRVRTEKDSGLIKVKISATEAHCHTVNSSDFNPSVTIEFSCFIV